MVALIRVVGLVLMAVVPGGLLVLSAFVLARLVAARFRAQHGPHRLQHAVAAVTVQEVWKETRRSLL